MPCKSTPNLMFPSISDELNDQEASNQSEATRLAAQEIQKLVEEKENLAKYLQEQVLWKARFTQNDFAKRYLRL